MNVYSDSSNRSTLAQKLGGLPLWTRQTIPQLVSEPSFQGMHPAAQPSPVNPALPAPVPQLKDLPKIT
jgi:hypothetical protein